MSRERALGYLGALPKVLQHAGVEHEYVEALEMAVSALVEIRVLKAHKLLTGLESELEGVVEWGDHCDDVEALRARVDAANEEYREAQAEIVNALRSSGR